MCLLKCVSKLGKSGGEKCVSQSILKRGVSSWSADVRCVERLKRS